ncbi:MAG TPA: LysM peptidoglycan-binding domain-containing protein [Vicinamibacterales bacterium]|nr:LysM peptidoglycan-binding domain-containing protein [Vicinamibacterales bacterium]
MSATRLEEVCPFLALGADHRTALDGPDRAHACHATDAPTPLTPAEQLGLCLTVRHGACPRYEGRVREERRTRRRPTPHAFTSTRPVVTPEPRDVTAPLRARARPLALAAGIGAFAFVGAGTWQAIGGVEAFVDDGRPAESHAAVAGGPAAAVTPAPRGTPNVAMPTPSPEATAALPEPTPAPTPRSTQGVPLTLGTPAPSIPPAPVVPEPQQYVVQQGDTLFDIAQRFGSSVDEIMSFNGLESDIINIDQVLLIP